MSHTPGPWALWADEISKEWTVYQPISGTDKGRYIALVDGKANASLIAAAPDMYQALLKLAAYWGAWARVDTNEEYDAMDADARIAVYSALAKAEGKE